MQYIFLILGCIVPLNNQTEKHESSEDMPYVELMAMNLTSLENITKTEHLYTVSAMTLHQHGSRITLH